MGAKALSGQGEPRGAKAGARQYFPSGGKKFKIWRNFMDRAIVGLVGWRGGANYPVITIR
ncbi:MAG: hypothetical protein DRH15_12765 [Deltaproteobacteria bacterium]|nr:MAG: hypothetical protein DRH15_12765 [Deltaproteobacteria bacterium]